MIFQVKKKATNFEIFHKNLFKNQKIIFEAIKLIKN